jgi:hypothetical protein
MIPKKFKLTTDKGSEIEMEENQTLSIDLDDVTYVIQITKI